jgi:ABC-type dipeptide/oligopeptide/nickel transport system permease component
VALGVMVVTFFLIRFALEDPAVGRARQVTLLLSVPPELVEQMRQDLGIEGNWIQQFGVYLLDLLGGDLGDSYQYSELSVAQLVGAGLGTTLMVAVLTAAVSSVLGIALGLATGTKAGRSFDRLMRGASTVAMSAPSALIALALILLLSVRLGWLPAGGWGDGYPENFRYLVLPVATLCVWYTPMILRVVRERVASVMADGHIEAARARGLSPWRITLAHVLPSCALPLVTMVALSMGGLLSGAVIVEIVFGIPGIGHVMTGAINTSDFPVIQALTIFTALVIVTCNMAAEVAGRAIDPRTR